MPGNPAIDQIAVGLTFNIQLSEDVPNLTTKVGSLKPEILETILQDDGNVNLFIF